MTGERFDNLTRLLVSHTLRRPLLTVAAWGLAALLAGALRLGGAPAAAGAGSLAGTSQRPGDQVCGPDQCCPLSAAHSPGICSDRAGALRRTGDRLLLHSGEERPGAAPRDPARTVHALTLHQASHPARSTKAGTPCALVRGRTGPGGAALAVRRARASRAPLAVDTLWPRSPRSPPPCRRRD